MTIDESMSLETARRRTAFIRSRLPESGLFAGQQWKISPTPFELESRLAKDLQKFGRVLLQFYRASDLLYRKSVEGTLPSWIADLLDQGKPNSLIKLQRSEAFKLQTPRVIRPDILLTEEGFSITELDSVPGGIGLIGWLNQTYDQLKQNFGDTEPPIPGESVSSSRKKRPQSLVGGPKGPIEGFRGIFGNYQRIHLVVSDESETYRPEMEWLAAQMSTDDFCSVRSQTFDQFQEGDAVYRFFELFDLENVSNASQVFDLASRQLIQLTPPPKYVVEEKMLFALLWNRNLRKFWRQEIGEGFLRKLQTHIPYSWVVDPSPLPPHAAYPELGLTDWHQLKSLSQKERRLILKISGFASEAWGSRGVYLGSDLSTEDWSQAVDQAIQRFANNPYILQRFAKPKTVASHWFDFEAQRLQPMTGRVRLCPYYFVHGKGDQARAELGGCLATVCPADKKIIHGMRDAILTPCVG